MKKIIYFLFLILSLNSYAGDFYTDNYEITAEIRKDNTIHYEENIDVDFFDYSHGIYRIIPIAGRLYYKINGKTIDDYRFSSINHIKSNYPYAQKIIRTGDGNYELIRLGNPEKYVVGKKNYKLTYDYTIYSGLTTKYDYDLIYLSLLPLDWKSNIENFNAKIILPKKIDVNKLKLYMGEYGNSKNKIDLADIQNLPNGKMEIQINLKNLSRRNGLTLFAHLPKGYFENTHTRNTYIYFLLGFGGILAILSCVLWFKFGRDPKIIETPEFYPPDGIDPVYLSYIVNSSIPLKDMSSLFIYMANKKYIKLDDNIDNLKMTKNCDIKALENENNYIKELFNELFRYEDIIYYKDLKIEFWENMADIYHEAIYECKKNVEKLKKSKFVKNILFIPLMIYIALIGGIIFFVGNQNSAFLIGITLILFFFSLSFINLINKIHSMNKFIFYIIHILYLLFGIMISIFLRVLTINSDFGDYGIYLGISIIISTFFIAYGDAMSLEGAKFIGRILGFKNYLRLVEVDKLKKLVDENPNYFYDIMPYAYVFGLSDVWINKIKIFIAENPRYNNSDMFFYRTMFFATYLNMATNTMTTAISDISTQGFGGTGGSGFSDFSGSGGFSGGGFGGGGGGSW